MNTVTIVTPNGSVPFKQDGDDQVVVPGLPYKNPIQSQYVMCLWPAIAKRHYTAGLGCVASALPKINFERVYVPKMSVTVTGPDMSLGGMTACTSSTAN